MTDSKIKKYVQIGIIFFATSLVFVYAYSRSLNLIKGPDITIENPLNGATLDSSFVTLEGTSKNIASITMNDRDIFIDENGYIREELLLSYGYNIFEFKGKDRFGREITKTVEYVYK